MIELIKKIIPNFVLEYYRNKKYGEQKKSYGDDNPDLIFYVIGFKDMAGGIFWLVNKALMHLAYALDKGYIPVIDYKNNETQYTGVDELGKINVWEKFYKQPFNYSLDDIRKSKNVIISCKYPSPDDEHFMGNFYDNPIRIKYFRDLYHKYFRYSDSVSEYLSASETLLNKRGKVLGVLCRGTDYFTLKPGGHPIPPSTMQVIEKVKQVFNEQGCDSIFLATEDEDVYQTFLSVFGDKLIVNHQKRVSKKQMLEGKELSVVKMSLAKTGKERFVSGLEYLTAIHLLSKCNSFVGVRCGGSKGALILSEGFDYVYTFDLGMY